MRHVLLWACALAVPIGMSSASAGQFAAPVPPDNIIPVQDGGRYYDRHYDDYQRGSDWQYRNPRDGESSDSLPERGRKALDELLGVEDRDADVVPPRAIVRELERDDYYDISRPVLDDGVYQVQAVDPRGRDVMLYIDAYDGQIVDRDYRG